MERTALRAVRAGRPVTAASAVRRRAAEFDGADLATPGRARALVRRALTRWGVPAEKTDALVTVVSELSTNAVTHAPGPRLIVVVSREKTAVRVAVIDQHGYQALRVGKPAADEEGGRGLAVVEGSTDRWGHCLFGRHQWHMVWAVVDFGIPLRKKATDGFGTVTRGASARPGDVAGPTLPRSPMPAADLDRITVRTAFAGLAGSYTEEIHFPSRTVLHQMLAPQQGDNLRLSREALVVLAGRILDHLDPANTAGHIEVLRYLRQAAVVPRARHDEAGRP